MLKTVFEQALEVESIREAMDDMFKESMAEREERIKRIEKEREDALGEVHGLSKKLDEISARYARCVFGLCVVFCGRIWAP